MHWLGAKVSSEAISVYASHAKIIYSASLLGYQVFFFFFFRVGRCRRRHMGLVLTTTSWFYFTQIFMINLNVYCRFNIQARTHIAGSEFRKTRISMLADTLQQWELHAPRTPCTEFEHNEHEHFLFELDLNHRLRTRIYCYYECYVFENSNIVCAFFVAYAALVNVNKDAGSGWLTIVVLF